MTGIRENKNEDPDAGAPARRWLFGPAVLDERTLELSVSGETLTLERKPLEVLLHLLQHAGEVVTKDELLAAVWPGRILADSSLTSCLYKLREALHDDDQSVIKTVHGFGYRLVAPVKVDAAPTAPRPKFEFNPGEHLPARPLWSLVERLGTGGHGEAWLARHDKTHERRVYKFAADTEALVSLKREITLYRLLHDSLGDRPDLVHLLDWNLEEPPYFVEYDYVEAGSLSTWAKSQGGIDRVPMETRVDIAAQVADALAAAHSVGVLHKDLKPSNVLVDTTGGRVQVKLCDFGSGGVLDVERLEQMGITRLGFTKTLAAFASTSATPLYLAPEIVAGQPFTVQADIYSLGVMLYQLVAGNFHKQLAPGWEQDVPDELLREDIGQAASGHAEQRLADAARLAQRLRTLDARRRQRGAERAEKTAADQAKLEIERVRARRRWVQATVAALVIGTTVSLALFVEARRARDRAEQAAANSRAVSDFLSKDLFAAVSGEQRPVRDLTAKELLDSAGAQVDKRFADNLGTAADVHLALGAAYQSLDDGLASGRHLEKALALLEQRGDTTSETALETAAELVIIKYVYGGLRDALPGYVGVRDRGRQALGRRNRAVLRLGQQVGLGHYVLGNWGPAAEELRSVLADAGSAPAPDPLFIAATESLLARSLLWEGDFAESEKVVRHSIEHLSGEVGNDHVRVAQARTILADVLTETGQLEAASSEISTGLDAARRWAPSEAAGYVTRARAVQGRLLTEQGHYREAEQVFEEQLRTYLGQLQRGERDQSATVRVPLAEAYQRNGRLADAEKQVRLALEQYERYDGTAHPWSFDLRIGLVDVLREEKRLAEAQAEFARLDRSALKSLPAKHPFLARLRREEGLLLVAQGKADGARAALAEALEICEYRYGSTHWRTQRARQELGIVPPAGTGRP